jgi:hypothetical protein
MIIRHALAGRCRDNVQHLSSWILTLVAEVTQGALTRKHQQPKAHRGHEYDVQMIVNDLRAPDQGHEIHNGHL